MPGVLIHAQALAQLLDDRPAPVSPAFVEPLVTLGASGLGLALVATGLPWPALPVAGAVAMLGWSLVAIVALGMGLPLLPWLSPMMAFPLTALLGASWFGREEREQRRFLRRAFERYLAPAVVARLIKHPDNLRLGGERRQVSVMFTDLAGFTGLAESLSAERLADILNPYLDGVLEIIGRYEGTVAKIVGDGIHAFFGAPETQADHAARAVDCALAIDAFANAMRARSTARACRWASHGSGCTRVSPSSAISAAGAARLWRPWRHRQHRIAAGGRQQGCGTASAPVLPSWPVPAIAAGGRWATSSSSARARRSTSSSRCATGRTRPPIHAFGLMAAGDTAAARQAFAELVAADPGDVLSRFHLGRLAGGETGTTMRFNKK